MPLSDKHWVPYSFKNEVTPTEYANGLYLRWTVVKVRQAEDDEIAQFIDILNQMKMRFHIGNSSRPKMVSFESQRDALQFKLMWL